MVMKKLLPEFYRKKGEKIQCLICQRKCLLSNGQLGFCLSKKNIQGELHDLIYSIIHRPQLDPIEKKPFYHVFPGESVLSIGSYGCNYRCKQCLNSWCSWGEQARSILKLLDNNQEPDLTEFKRVNPENLIKIAEEQK